MVSKMKLACIVFFLLAIRTALASCGNKPNIVFIFADDLGWNDVSFHGSDQIPTPNIDMLAYSGVALGRYYTHAMCTPSRSAFLTGKYSHRVGMQGVPLAMSEDRGIPINETLLPEYFKAAGYATHLVGKWHVGCSRNEFLPTSRGFDTHFGHRGGFMDYYEYTIEEEINPTISGLTLYNNMTPAWDVEGYITDVYTDYAVSTIMKHDESSPLFLVVGHAAPHAAMDGATLQAPPEVIRQMRHVELTPRRVLAAMVKKLDDSVGDIVKALYDKGILNNTIIVFVSDNGGRTTGLYHNYASNYPLRGLKLTPFEGGVRVVGTIWSADMKDRNHYYDGYIHVADWLPTLLTAAGVNVPSDIDGINQWENINMNKPSDRTVMYEIDDLSGYYSITFKQFKLITGKVDPKDSTYQGGELRGIIGNPPSYSDAILSSKVHRVLTSMGQSFSAADLNLRNKTIINCHANASNICFLVNDTVCLFNIIDDPCETTDLSESHSKLVLFMTNLLNKEIARRIPRQPPYYDPLSDPKRFNYTWTPWIPDSAPLTQSK